jgi:factor associated with neutral sphingomyelinase activation
VIADYASERIDLDDPAVYRDLARPMGALNAARLRAFKERYEDMPEPKFLYGSHYSAPGYVIGYLVRKHPEYMLKLQSGKFDKPDRLFKSIKGDWKNVT